MEYKHNGGEWLQPFLPKHPNARKPKLYFGSVAITIASDIFYIDAYEQMKLIHDCRSRDEFNIERSKITFAVLVSLAFDNAYRLWERFIYAKKNCQRATLL